MKIVQVFCWSLVVALCRTTEYYVRPTDPTDISCPAQPCLTLSQYINNSDLYFKSNTVFKFLPGLHHANQTLDMQSVENVSLEGEQRGNHPELMMYIQCSSHGCSGLHFYNISNLIIQSLSFSIYIEALHLNHKVSPVSGFFFVEVSNLQMHLASVELTSLDFIYSSGIKVFKSKHVFLYLASVMCTIYCRMIDIEDSENVSVLNVSVAFGDLGLAVKDSRNISIRDSYVVFTSLSGIDLHSNIAVNICNVVVKLPKENGMIIDSSQYTSISNTAVLYAKDTGIWLNNSANTDIVNTIVSHSGFLGLELFFVHHVNVTNTTVTESFEDGIVVFSSTYITFFNTSVMYIGAKNFGKAQDLLENNDFHSCHITKCHGLFLDKINNAILYDVRIMHSEVGIGISTCVNITIKSTNVTHVSKGITSVNGSNIHISYASLNVSKFAIHARGNEDTVIATVAIVFIQFQETALLLTHCHNVQMKNIFLVPRVLVEAYIPEVLMGVYKQEPAIFISFCNGVAISKSVFANFSYLHTITGQSAIVVLFESSNITFIDCDFKRNNITSLHVVCSQFTVMGILRFTGNRAYVGGAIIFDLGSTMTLSQNGSVFFVDNHASLFGGAIYLQSSGYTCSYVYVSDIRCFLPLEQHDLCGGLTFVNNSAEKGGDAVYGRLLGFPGYDVQKDIACFTSFNRISHISPDTLSKVASDPYRVCICNNNMPLCAVPSVEVDPIFPGQSFMVTAVVVGVEGGTVAGSVFANFVPIHAIRPQLSVGERTKKVTQVLCNELEYTIFSINTYEVLGLTTDYVVGEYSDPTPFTEIPMLINITLLPCPPGFTLQETSGKCDCSQFLLQLPGVTCNIKDQTIHRSGLVWVGSVKDHNQTIESVITAKYCPLNYCKHEDIDVKLNQPDTQCEFNHSGILCGGCQPGLSQMLGGVQCEVCSNKNLALIIPFLLAGVVLVFFLKISNLTTSHGFINSLVFYASIVKANDHVFLPQANTNPLTLFISWLNLDLGVQTCLFNGLSAYTKTWLQFVFPFYIWGITGVIIISARYSIRIARISGNNSVPVLATLFLLSYAKLLGIIITSLSYTVLEFPGGQKLVWSTDGNIDYLGPKHAPLFVAAVATLLFLWLPYTVLLFIGQWLYKCRLGLINRMLIKLKPFLDAHYGPLKDKYRYWFGALLLVRAVILLISALVIKNNFSIFLFSISIATVVLIMLTAFSHIGIDLRTYRSKTVSFFEYSIFINLMVLCLAKYHTSVGGGNGIAASYTLIGTVFVQFVCLMIFKVYSVLKNKIFRYLPLNESKKEEGVWRYENSIEMQTTQYRNADNIS